MQKLTVSVLGHDCPGIIATVAKLMQDAQCNITNVSQTILAGEFASIFMVDSLENIDKNILAEKLRNGLVEAMFDLSVTIRPSNDKVCPNLKNSQPFVITVDGQDQIGLIAGMSDILFQYQVNIENMKAVLGEDCADHALFLFEVMVPHDTNIVQFRKSLSTKAKELNVKVSVQHRNIFEAIHRVMPV